MRAKMKVKSLRYGYSKAIPSPYLEKNTFILRMFLFDIYHIYQYYNFVVLIYTNTIIIPRCHFLT